jgi:hypothetical protein
MINLASRQVQRTRHGRHTATSITAPRPFLSAVAPAAPTKGNKFFASAAPDWKHTIDTTKMATGPRNE